MKKRSFVTAVGALLISAIAWAGEPISTKPIRIIVPYAPGGGPDILARQLAQKLALETSQTVFVENKVGAGGMLAGEVAALAPPDGHTLLLGASTHVTQKILEPKLNFDPLKSFVHITLSSTSAAVLVVPANSPYKTVKELTQAVKSQPGKLNYASGGVGSAAHLAGASLLTYVKGDALHVPYKGSVEIVPSLLSGDTQFGFPVLSTALPFITQGKIRALAVTSAVRLPQLPDVPTLRETYDTDALVQESWSGIWAPAGTPKSIVEKLYKAITAALNNPELRKNYEATGTAVAISKSPDEFTSFIKNETEKYVRIVKASGISSK